MREIKPRYLDIGEDTYVIITSFCYILTVIKMLHGLSKSFLTELMYKFLMITRKIHVCRV